MGHGWKVWLRDDEVCRSAPGDTPMPFGCRSLTDGNIGGLNVQSSGSPTGVMMSGLIPYRPARLVVRHSGVELEPTLRRIRGHGDWTFWSLWLDADSSDVAGGKLLAFDSSGRQVESLPL